MENKQLATYRYYDSKGRRLSIFGKESIKAPGFLEIVKIPCSFKDIFKKKVARDIYQQIEKGEVKAKDQTFIRIEEGNSPGFQFDLYCKKTYRKMQDFQLLLVGKGFIANKVKVEQTLKGISVKAKVLEYAK